MAYEQCRQRPRRLRSRLITWVLAVVALPAGAATITVQVAVDRNDVEDRFDLDMGGEAVSLLPGEIATDDDVSGGRYAITLAPRDGFDLTGIVCTNRANGSPLPAAVTLDAGGVIIDPAAGATVDCVFSVEARLATVVATLQADRPDVEQAFSLDMGGTLVSLWPGGSATDADARADRYAMTLTPVPGYRLTDIACTRRSDGNRLPANLTLENGGILFAPGSGATADCLFSLEAQRATVTATVTVNSPEPVEQSFELSIASEVVTLWPGNLATDDEATPDFYAMTLVPQNGYQLMDIACVRRADGQRLAANVDLGLGAITLAPGTGNIVDCEFMLRPVVATVSATITTDSTTPVETEFTLEMNGEPVLMLPDELATDRNARPDLYRMALVPERRFRLDDVSCVRQSDNERLPAEINYENQSVALAPGIGNQVHCTFHLNALQAAVTARVLTNRQHVEETFEIEMNGERFTLAQGEAATDERSRPDLYRIALVPVRDFRLMDIACLRDGERRPATIDADNWSVAFAPGTGGHVNCTFSLQALRAQVTARASLAGAERQLTFDMNGDEVTIPSGELAIDGNANALLYRVALIPEPGLRVTDIACSRAGERLSALTDLNNQSIGFSPGAGSSVDCVFAVEGGSVTVDPFDLLRQSGTTLDGSNTGLTLDPDGRPRITLGVPGAGADGAPPGSVDALPGDDNAPRDASCCSCTELGSAFVPASSRTGPSQVPCDFDIPAGWEARWGNDGLMVSVVAGPACSQACPSGSPSMGMAIGLSPNSNAEVQEEAWRQIMPVVGSGRCGEGGVTLYQPPGGVPGEASGAVRFHITLGGERYGGTAFYSCGGPPDWGRLQDLFIRSFRSNPGAAFPP